MSNDIQLPRRRLKRAWRYFQELNGYLLDWRKEGDPYEIRSQTDLDKARIDYFVKVIRYPPLDDMGFTIGDFVHNVRAPLDNLIWGIGQRYGSPDKRKLHFPICANVEQFAEIAQLFKKFPREARVLIEGFQPYHRPDNPTRHPLWILNRLWNDDKHRAPAVVVSAITGSVVGTTNSTRIDPHIDFVRFTGNDEMHVGYVTLLDRTDTYVEAKLIIDIAFDPAGPAKGRMLGDVLAEIYDFVHDEAFPALEPFL
jgi:hypothetical protein